VRNARAAIEAFEEAALTHARHRGFDGVICGHIHKPEIREIDSTLYCNDGDWVDNCTALVENLDGSLELLHWSAVEQSLKTLIAANEQPDTLTNPAAAEIC
jgi:UDP-2,3-diacylglucosamine pyrophosphatase LpxH